MKEIFIIRHGETELNRLGIVQGSGVDAGLNDTGQQQAQAEMAQLADSAQDILDEEKENQKRRNLRARGGFREVDKDW